MAATARSMEPRAGKGAAGARRKRALLLAAAFLGCLPGALRGQPVRVIVGPAPPQPAAPAVRGAGSKPGKAGLHIASKKQASFPMVLTDGAGYQWDIQRYGSINRGTSGAYSGGLCLYVGSSRLIFNGQGWISAAGDEVEMGPITRNNLRISRRIKVYRDRGLARWLDIYENPTARPITVTVRIWSDMITTVRRTVASSGKNSFTAGDHAFVTVVGVGSVPALMHYVCSADSKLRPTVSVRSDDINVHYTFAVPAGGAAVVCYFEAQHRSADTLIKQMQSLRLSEVLRDLPSSLRKRLVNMPVRGGYGGVELDRSTASDVVRNRHGDPIFGTITNESFHLETLFGPVRMPAEQVIGLASAGSGDRQFRALLTGGQILAGQVAEDANVALKLPAGGTLRVPFGALEQCAFRVSKQRPDKVAFAGPLMVLRTGDRVAFDPNSVKLSFRTRHGVVRLAPKQVLSVALDQEGNGVHRATFLNGSRLAGFLEPEQVPLTLKLGPRRTISRNLIAEVRFADEEKPNPLLDSVLLSNGDELFGGIAEESFVLHTRYGKTTFRPDNVAAISLSRTHLRRAAVTLWDGSVLRGQIDRETLAFRIEPGPRLNIYVGQCVRIRRSQALPPKQVSEALRRWVGQLGAESHRDRQAATEELVKMGKGIIPMLRKYLDASDAEVRQRVEDVIERLGG